MSIKDDLEESGVREFFSAYGHILLDQIAPSIDAATAKFETRSKAAAATIGSNHDYIQVTRYSAGTPVSPAIYERAEASSTGSFTSADGAHWVPAWDETRLEMLGAVGDGITDDNREWYLARTLGKPIYLTDGLTYLVTDGRNSEGVPVRGPGRIVTLVAGGGFLQHNLPKFDSPVQFRHFGHAVKDAIAAGTAIKAVIFGDSTATNGYGLTIADVVSNELQNMGVGVAEVTNEAVAGTSWSTTDYSERLDGYAEQKHLAIFKFGINDAGSPPTTIQSARVHLRNSILQRLSEVRASTYGDASDLSILLLMPNVLGNTAKNTSNRNNLWLEAIQGVYWEAARDYECMIYNPLVESRWADGQEGKSLDSFLSHPTENYNYDIWGRALQETLAPFATVPRNRFVQLADGELGELDAADDLTDFPMGLSTMAADIADGWPINGYVETVQHPGALGRQTIYDDTKTYATGLTRHWVDGTGWAGWSGVPVTLTLENSWVAYGGKLGSPTAVPIGNGMVLLEGAMKSGTDTAWTTLFTLPDHLRPSVDHFVNGTKYVGGTTIDTTLLHLKTTGEVQIVNDVENDMLSISGILFRAVTPA